MIARILVAAAILSSAPAVHAQCTPQSLAGGQRFAVHGDLLAVADEGVGQIDLFRWGGTSWEPDGSVSMPSITVRWEMAVSEDHIAIIVCPFFHYELLVSARVGGAFQPFTSQMIGNTAHFGQYADDRASLVFDDAGDHLVVGLAGYEYELGGVMVFQRPTTPSSAWPRISEFGGIGAGVFSLGTSVDMDGSVVVAGSPGNRRALVRTGSLHWTLDTVLTSGIGAIDDYGIRVAVHGDYMAIAGTSGAPLPVELFIASPSGWTSIGAPELPVGVLSTPPYALDIHGGRLVVGLTGQPFVLEYEIDGGGATHVRTRMGASLPLTDAVRAPFGTLALSDTETRAWPEDVLIVESCHCAVGPCGNGAIRGGCTNASGTPAVLSGCGTTRASADDLVLRLEGLTPNTWGTIFMGRLGSVAPLQNGQLCLGGALHRFQPELASGTTMVSTGLIAFSQAHHPPAARLGAGQTWSFQCWYRDAGGPCGHASNLTNALTVTFRP